MIGVQANPTGTPTIEHLNGVPTQLFPDAVTLEIELVLTEETKEVELMLTKGSEEGGERARSANSTLTFVPHRSTGNEAYSVEEALVVMKGGRLSVTLGPNELLTLRQR